MKKITFSSAHRQKHFEFFTAMDQPHFNITARIDVSSLLPLLKQQGISVNAAIVFLVSDTANAIPQFRQRIRHGEVVEHEYVHPSFTVFTEVADVFSFCEVKYSPEAQDFLQRATERIEKMRTAPSFEDEEGRDDYLFLSAIPWIHFTNLQHAMHYSPVDSVPRISWGKFMEEHGKWWMPLSVQAHHALVDGRHMGQYFELFQKKCTEALEIFG